MDELSEKNKREDFTPKKRRWKQGVYEKSSVGAKFIQRYVENNILSSIEF